MEFLNDCVCTTLFYPISVDEESEEIEQCFVVCLSGNSGIQKGVQAKSVPALYSGDRLDNLRPGGSVLRSRLAEELDRMRDRRTLASEASEFRRAP